MSHKRKYEATSIYHIPAEAVEHDYIPTSAYVDEISTDGRRIKRMDHICYAPLDSSHLHNLQGSQYDDLWTFEPEIREPDEVIADEPTDVATDIGPVNRQFSTVSSIFDIMCCSLTVQ